MRNLPHQLTMRKPEAAAPKGLRFVNSSQPDTTDIYLYDEISSWWGVSAKDFIDQLKEVNTSNINLHINSPGGEIFEGQAIYNSLKQHDANVTVYIDALAASAASFVAMAGDTVIAARNATMMIHDGMGFSFGNAQDMRDTAKLLDMLSNNIADMYFQKAGGSVTEWRDLMKAETWYTAAEAKSAGLVDTVLDTQDPAAQAETNKWDLSFFNYQGRDAAPDPSDVRRMILSNRVKEAHMAASAPKNKDESSSSQSGTESDESQNTGPAGEPGAEAQAESQPVEEQATPPVPSAPEQPTQPATQPEQNTSHVIVNGAPVTDMRAIQNHINSLETFRNEAIEQHRVDFVAQLARDNKISATQIGDKETGLTAFALGLSDEQFSNWASAYKDAPSLGMFSNHGVTPGDGTRPANGPSEGSREDRIQTLEAIVADHRRTGMDEETLMNKASYKELEALKAQQ